MKNLLYILLVFIFSESCSSKFKSYRSYYEKKDSYDSYFVLNKDSIAYSNSKIKFNGVYIKQDPPSLISDTTYLVIKFYPDGRMIYFRRINNPSDNTLINRSVGSILFYNERNDTVKYEYLNPLGYKYPNFIQKYGYLYNVIVSGRISETGDTLIFYSHEVVQDKRRNKKYYNKKIYVFDSTINGTPDSVLKYYEDHWDYKWQ